MDDKKFLILFSAAAALMLSLVLALLFTVVIDSRGHKDASEVKFAGGGGDPSAMKVLQNK